MKTRHKDAIVSDKQQRRALVRELGPLVQVTDDPPVCLSVCRCYITPATVTILFPLFVSVDIVLAILPLPSTRN